ncbi:hypothetical protein R3P38DRAFT_2479511, partial [Favolaschia claudopus]
VPLSFAVGDQTRACMLRDVLHCPTAPCNLISLARLTDAGYHAIFHGDTVKIQSKTGTVLAIGDKISRLYKLRIASQPASCPPTYAFPARTWDEWH